MTRHFIFVYGTLRRGGVRAMPDLFPNSRFVNEAQIGGSLYDLGAFPGLLLNESNSLVIGEVYEIDDEILYKLDEIEASTHYWRKQVEIPVGNSKETCWVYESDRQRYSYDVLIPSGDWIEYARTDKGEHR
ncbi:MAG: gamma-glutamylcyclotransferase [Acidobacteriota bacterium]